MSRRVILATLLAGCGPQVAVDDDTSTTGGEATTDASVGSTAATSVSTSAGTTDATTSPGTTSTTGTTGVDTSTDDSDGETFIQKPDGSCFTHCTIECDVWAQDCPPGEKCMPWANDGGNSWNATRCSPVAADPDQPGEACTVEGNGVSGIDSCDIASMCWHVDPETGEGVCLAFCTGSENNPVCTDPETSCSIGAEGTLILCFPTCDPLAQDCPPGFGCWGIDDDFVCAPDAGGDTGAYGDPCEFLNVCDPGLACVNPDVVPGCASAGCCSPFCNVAAAENCPGEGQECIPWFDPESAPPGYENVGICGIPT
jgi:hypothetical protein